MEKFFAELKRRHMYRVAAAYAVVAWVLLQIVNNVAPGLNLPSWATTLVIVLLAIGFPVALVFAWIGELKSPESKSASSEAKITRMDYVLAGALIVVIALVGYQQLAPSRSATGQQSGAQAARDAAASPAGTISIAVLPFANLSGDPGQEFFSDGITEEITSALAKVPDLRVVARTSSSRFKNENRDIQEIAQLLHATHVIEGSVRKAGDRLRITAQLINGADGTHVWSEDYDRQLTDVFAIQEDIARTITSSLRMPLGLKPGENLINNRGIDPASYQDFLRAKALVLVRGANSADAVKILEPLVTRYPNYAPARIQLAWAYAFENVAGRSALPASERRQQQEAVLAKMEMAAERAQALDANLPDAYLVLGVVASLRGNLLQGEELCKKALALDPGHSEGLHQCAFYSAMEGRLKETLAMRVQLRALDPLVPAYSAFTVIALWLNGRNDEAIALAKQTSTGGAALARIYAAMGRYAEAADVLQQGPADAVRADAVRLLRTAPASVTASQSLPRLEALNFVYLYVGAPERVLEYYEERTEDLSGTGTLTPNEISLLWHSSYAPVRKTERFKALVRKIGLVDYWRAKGWPEFCHPTTGDDFVCS